MSELSISNNILHLRRERKLTQEQLADFIGVTKTSVSKWETGTTMPDIQLLPSLASFFGISVDELLGYSPQLSKEQVQKYYFELAEEFGTKSFNEVFQKSEALVKKYYSCYPFLQQIAILWLNHTMLAPSEEEKQHIYQKIIELCHHITSSSVNLTICKNASVIEAMVNLQCGQQKRVIEQFEDELDVNSLHEDGTLLTLAYLMTGQNEEGIHSAQIGLFRNLMNLFIFSLYLLSMTKTDRAYFLQSIERMDAMADIFELEQLNPNTLAGYHYQVALLECEYLASSPQLTKEEKEECEASVFWRLDKYLASLQQLFKDDLKLHGDEFFSTLDSWFEGNDLGTNAVRSEKVVKESSLATLQSPVFHVLTDQSRLQTYSKAIEAL